MDEHSDNFNKKRGISWRIRVEESSNRNKKCTRENKQIRGYKKIDQGSGRQNNGNHPNWKERIKRNEDRFSNPWDNIKHRNTGII